MFLYVFYLDGLWGMVQFGCHSYRRTIDPARNRNLKNNHTMKNTLNTYDIAHALHSDEFGGWSYAGAKAMAEYLEELEEDCGMEMELDVVAIRCDYTEYGTLQEWISDYYSESLDNAIKSAGIDLDEDDGEDEIDEWIRSHIQDHGQLIEFDGGIIVSSF